MYKQDLLAEPFMKSSAYYWIRQTLRLWSHQSKLTKISVLLGFLSLKLISLLHKWRANNQSLKPLTCAPHLDCRLMGWARGKPNLPGKEKREHADHSTHAVTLIIRHERVAFLTSLYTTARMSSTWDLYTKPPRHASYTLLFTHPHTLPNK